MSDTEAAIAAAFAEALDAECGLGLPGLAVQVDGGVVRASWHGEELARWDGHDPEDPLDPEDIGAELLEALGDPRQEVVDFALRVVGRELEAAQEAARRAGGDEVRVAIEDRGDLGRARHWTTDAELAFGWPEVVVVVELGGEERAIPFAPEQHPNAIDLVEVEAAARELAGS